MWFLVDGLTRVHRGASLIGFNDLLKKKDIKLGERFGGSWIQEKLERGCRGEYDQNALYTYNKFSKNEYKDNIK